MEPALKWPNDLLVGGAKLAGVLAEAEFAGAALTAVVVGIGLNVAWPGPAGARRHLPGRRGRDGEPVDRRVLLDRLLGSVWHPGAPCSRTPAGRRASPTRCAGAAPRLGQRVRVALAAEELVGRAERHRRRRPSGRRDGDGHPTPSAPATWCTCGLTRTGRGAGALG